MTTTIGRQHTNTQNAQLSETESRIKSRYAVGVTDHVYSTIKGDVHNDPVAKQYIPQLQELTILPDENTDPIGDFAHTPVKGLVHRHKNRVLLKLANVCAVYCRYCFRREMIGPGADVLNKEEREAAYTYITAHPEIREVILTGGDPLILSVRNLKDALDRLCDIPHLTNIRIHTRIPIADPLRITEELGQTLKRDLPVYVVLHINHAQEITDDVRAALKILNDAGCMLLSQSVLLNGVNDDPQILAELCDALIGLNVKPYYIHHPDKAPGTSHFRVPLEHGQNIMHELRSLVSGIAMPQYMIDIPGGYGKVPVNADYVRNQEDGTYLIEDERGVMHVYKD